MVHRITTDGIAVTEDEARELMFHHLLLAQRFFEALDDDPSEHQILMKELSRVLGHDPAASFGAHAFIVALESHYEELKSRD